MMTPPRPVQVIAWAFDQVKETLRAVAGWLARQLERVLRRAPGYDRFDAACQRLADRLAAPSRRRRADRYEALAGQLAAYPGLEHQVPMLRQLAVDLRARADAARP